MKTARFFSLAIVTLTLVSFGCHQQGRPLARNGDEIMVAGQLFHTGAPVVLWTDPGGYDAYRTERRFAPWDKADYAPTTQEVKDIKSPARYGVRSRVLEDAELERVRGGGWPLEMLQDK